MRSGISILSSWPFGVSSISWLRRRYAVLAESGDGWGLIFFIISFSDFEMREGDKERLPQFSRTMSQIWCGLSGSLLDGYCDLEEFV